MLHILIIIAPLFLIIFASALIQKLTNIGEKWSPVLNDFALKIGFPALIFSTLAKASFSFSEQLYLIISNSLFVLLIFLLVIIVSNFFSLGRQMTRTLFICFPYSNVAYLGIPILTQTFGTQILPSASLIVAVYLFWIFLVGLGYLEYTSDTYEKNVPWKILKNLFGNPLLVAVILGTMVGSLKITLPVILLKALEMVTATVTPIVLIVIGLFIGKSKIGNIVEWFPILAFSSATLIILPSIYYLGVKIFGFLPNTFSASIIDSAMPLGITPFALADKYNLDKDFIARSIVLSTILSVISLPLWISNFIS